MRGTDSRSIEEHPVPLFFHKATRSSRVFNRVIIARLSRRVALISRARPPRTLAAFDARQEFTAFDLN